MVWQRKLSLALGVSAHSTAITLAAFMGGLALGSLWGGRLAERTRPARLYAVAEIVLAALALGATFLLDALPAAYVALVGWFGSGAGANVARALLAGLVLLPPTICMGVTIPALLKAFARRGEGIGASAGFLSAVNTLGAAAGTLGAAFFLIERYGLLGTVLLAVGANVLVALTALVLARGEELPAVEAPAARGALPSPRRDAVVWFVLAASGLTTFANETLWTRALLFSIGDNSAFAFAEMLATVLIGLVIGDTLGGLVADRVRHPKRLLGILQLLLAAAVAASVVTMRPAGVLEELDGGRSGGADPSMLFARESLVDFAMRAFVESARIVLPAAILAGMGLPVAIRILGGGASDPGRIAGKALMVNTLGAVLGALAGGFLLLPLLGFQMGLLASAAVSLVVGSAAVLSDASVSATGRVAPWLVAAGLVIAAAVPAWSTEPPWKKALTQGRPGFEVIHYADGVSASVGVVRRIATDDRVLWVDNDAQAGTDAAMRVHLALLGHLGAAFHPEPRSGLVVGFGCGISVAALAMHPFERIDVAELSPEVVAAARFFESANGRVHEDPRVSIRFEDGRNFLLASPGGYDVITSDPIDPDDAGVTSLYSREYFRLVRSRLAPGGVACHWIPTQYSTAVYGSLVGAFREAFPNAWVFDADFTTVIVGRREDGPAAPWARLEAVFADERARRSLAECGVDAPEDLLALRLAGPRGLLRFHEASGGLVNTDDRPIAEYAGPRSLRSRSPDSWNEKFELLLRGEEEGIEALVADVPASAQPRLAAARAAAERAFRARMILASSGPEWVPALRARLLALRRPAPRFVDVACGLDGPEFAPGADTAEFDAAFAAGLDALEKPDPGSALVHFDRALGARAASPRALLGLLVAGLDAKEPLVASYAAVELLRWQERMASVVSGVLKGLVELLIRRAADPARRDEVLARVRALVPALADTPVERLLEGWRGIHRTLDFRPDLGRFEARPPGGS